VGTTSSSRRMRLGLAVSVTALLATSAVASGQSPAASGQPFAGQTLNVLVTPYHEGWDAILAPDFEAATGATVNYEYVPFDGMQAKLATILASGDDSYDLVWAPVTFAPAFAGTLYADISQKLDPAIQEDLVASVKVGDALYAVPTNDTSVILAWNKDLYEKAGLDPEKPPTTFEELFAQCDALLAAEVSEYCFDWNIPNANGSFSFWSILLNAAGGAMWDESLSKVAFDTPEGLAAMQTFATFMHDKPYVDPASWVLPDQFATGDRFAAGTLPVAFLFDLQGPMMDDPATSKIAGDVGWTIIPGIGDNRSGTIDGWEGYGLSAFARNPDLAVAYLEYLLTPDAQTKQAAASGLVPVLKSTLAEGGSGSVTAPVTAEQYEHQVNRWGAGFYNDVAEVFDPILHQLALGDITPEAALEAAASGAQAKIDEYNAR